MLRQPKAAPAVAAGAAPSRSASRVRRLAGPLARQLGASLNNSPKSRMSAQVRHGVIGLLSLVDHVGTLARFHAMLRAVDVLSSAVQDDLAAPTRGPQSGTVDGLWVGRRRVEEERHDLLKDRGAHVHRAMHAFSRRIPVGLTGTDREASARAVLVLQTQPITANDDGEPVARIGVPGRRLARLQNVATDDQAGALA